MPNRNGAPGQQPGKRAHQADPVQLPVEQLVQAREAPVVHVLGVVSERSQMLAAHQAAQSEPRLVWNRHDHRACAHPRQFGQRSVEVFEVLEDLQAQHQVELGVPEREVVHARAAQVDGRQTSAGEVDGGRLDVDADRSFRQRIAEPSDRLALAAARVENGRGSTSSINPLSRS